MKLIVTLLCVFVQCATNVYACPKQVRKVVEDPDLDPAGYYTLREKITPSCGINRSEISLPEKESFALPSSCQISFPSELEKIFRGYHELLPDFESTHLTTSIPCETSDSLEIDGKTYNLPNGMVIRKLGKLSYSVHVYDKQALSKMRLTQSTSGIDETFNEHSKFLEAMIGKRSQQRFVGLRLYYHIYDATLLNPNPRKNVLFRYRSLPETLENNEVEFYSFISRFGTAIRTTTIYGGLIEADVTDFNVEEMEKTQWEDLLNDLLQNTTHVSPEIFVLGGHRPNSIATWIENLKEKPFPISSEVKPIYNFLETNNESEKKKSLTKMVNNVKNSFKLRQVIYALEIIALSKKISKFIRKIATEQLVYICPSKEIMDMIDFGMLYPENFELNQFTITCTHDLWINWDDDVLMKTTRHWSLIPGLCFTRENVFTTCVRTNFRFPPKVNCIKFYESNSCNGIIHANVSPFSFDVDKIIFKSKSFEFC